ncbi:SCO7613 C-terminal domain-containing membrane protein [Glycomyces sp. MUSA5-2]|uniref:SCO7613 C-terminal domain-containing membrane protein n=1 Tax=Glycomyces sp. MUSA5-2 TaxID=2053002 RepID=UPI00300AA122
MDQPVTASEHLPPQPPPPPADRPGRRAEVTAKSVQIVLLCLGGLLLTAGVIVFTAVAWRQLGDGGRLTILAGTTGLLMAVPFALTRFRLWATAETLAATATLALWCSALAGYYLYLPSGTGLTAVSVARWTAAVLVAAALYRIAARVAAPAWALLPLAATGAAFAAFGDALEAALHMGAIGLLLAGAAWTVKAAPTRHTGADQWSARVLLAAAITTVFLAGMRAAFGLDAAILPVAAATGCLLAAACMLATAHARFAGASTAAVAVLGSAAGALTIASWVLALRSLEPLVAVPAFGLSAVAVILAASWTDPNGYERLPLGAAASAVTASLAVLGAVITDAYELTAFFAAAVLSLAVSFIFPAALADALRKGAMVIGASVLAWCTFVSATALPVAYGAEPNPLVQWEVPAIAVGSAVGVFLVAKGWRRDFLALAAATAAMSAGALAGRSAASLAAVAALAVLVAFTSPGTGRRVLGWTAAYPAVTAAALAWAYRPATNDLDPGSALAVAVGVVSVLLAATWFVRRGGDSSGDRGRADLVWGRVGAHSMIGVYLVWLTGIALADGISLDAPLGFTAYAGALAAAAIANPAKRLGHVLGSCASMVVAALMFAAYGGATAVEWYTVPPAVVLVGLGLWLLRHDAATSSWLALGPALAVGFGPSLVMALGPEGDPWRRIAVGAAAVAVLMAGAWRRWQAPLVLGAVVLTALAVNEIALVWSAVPKWIPLSIGGAVLIAAGATLEQRRRDLARIGRSLKAMR